ncbi:ArsR family transcriptional regulator [Streptomyces sp. NPDC059070]|uniref:ArsR family transcriptional regulator n=1 Tax=Streptomyces sp. NPDC059070 TaxID=3346713 RepID=UPI0036B04E37
MGNIRVCSLPDFDAELTAAGVTHAHRAQPYVPLAQLYSRSTTPDLAEGVGPAYLSHLFTHRGPTPFTRALAEGDGHAHRVLAQAVDQLRASAVEPYRSGIHAAVAARTAALASLYVDRGASALLHGLGHGIRFRQGVLEVPTVFDADFELGSRSLLIQAVALRRRVALAEPADGHLTVRLPAGSVPRTEPERLRSLHALLGPDRAEALTAIVASGGVTGGQLASLVGVSDAAASRRAAALRQAGLIRSLRVGRAVRHVATPLGHHLARPEATDAAP